jgi:hypothetical protein
MPLRLNVGLQRKIGQPNYGSLGASCHLEMELDGCLLDRDPGSLQDHIVEAFAACREAVHDELMRQVAANVLPALASDSGHAPNGNGKRLPPVRMATLAQVRALNAIADRRDWDLPAELLGRFGVARPEELTRVEASQCIQQFNDGVAEQRQT